jgi:hypothetical protein
VVGAVRAVIAIAVAGAFGALARCALVPLLDEMVSEGLVTIEQVHVLTYRAPDSTTSG